MTATGTHWWKDIADPGSLHSRCYLMLKVLNSLHTDRVHYPVV
ncbi:hypothetical protein [Erwinia amylovora]|nr:hypothetical protein [Erwinia amylovora]